MAEKEYIERDDAIDALCYFDEKSPTGRTAQEIVKAIPAADVRPVVRGKWIWTVDDDEYLGEYWKCNLCGEHSYIGYNFCPNCGAMMEERL